MKSTVMYLVAVVVVLCFLAVAQSQSMCFVLRSHEPGDVTNPALSCSEIAEQKPQLSSGMYWLKPCTSEEAVQVYCDLEKEFPTGTKGWMRVANLDMTDPNEQCPPNFNLYTQPKRLCGKRTKLMAMDVILSNSLPVVFSTIKSVEGLLGISVAIMTLLLHMTVQIVILTKLM